MEFRLGHVVAVVQLRRLAPKRGRTNLGGVRHPVRLQARCRSSLYHGVSTLGLKRPSDSISTATFHEIYSTPSPSPTTTLLPEASSRRPPSHFHSRQRNARATSSM